MKHSLIIPFLLFLLSGCSTVNTVGNGAVDPIEEVALRLSVSLALDNFPVAIEPAYIVSSVLLATIDTQSNDAVLVSTVDKVIDKQVLELNLTPQDKVIFNSLTKIVKDDIKKLLDKEKIPNEQRVIVVKDLIKIINEVAMSKR